MPRPFAQSTAELVMQVTEAVQANGEADSTFVQNFCDLSATQADNALKLAADLGLLQLDAGKYTSANPIVSFVATPDESRKATDSSLIPMSSNRSNRSCMGSGDGSG